MARARTLQQFSQTGSRLSRSASQRLVARNLRQRLEGLSKLEGADIQKALREEVLRECEDELRVLRRETLARSEQDLQAEAKRILIAAMQRLASKPNNDITATIVHLPTEEMKGRIIGREGRNIRAFESITGVTVLVDDTPNAVTRVGTITAPIVPVQPSSRMSMNSGMMPSWVGIAIVATTKTMRPSRPLNRSFANA